MEVPLAGICMTRMGARIVSHFKVQGIEPLLQQPLDVRGSRIHAACASLQRDDSQSACPNANTNSAIVRPANLKYTQARSLRL